MKSTTLTFILFMILTIIGCQKGEFAHDGDYFYLSNEGAKLPIWVKGNTDSDVILITVHGGPGDGGMGFSISKGFKFIEEDYLVAYWDQRFAALAQGHPDKNTIHVDQYIEDTKKVVELIQSKYPDKKLFILGHSWGGQLSAGYVGREDNQNNFKGWIDLNGSIYGELEVQLMKEWIFERIPAEMAKPDANIEYWQYIIDWYAENPDVGNFTDPEPYWYVSALHGDTYFWETYNERNPIPYAQLIFNSMFGMSYYVSAEGGNQSWGDEINFTPEVENIKIPVLLLWGAEDGIVPAKVADYVYEHLGTNESEKHLVKIPECGHGPQNDQPEKFYTELSNFIETYR